MSTLSNAAADLQAGGRRRPSLGAIAIGVLALVAVLAVIIVLLGRGPATYPADSPEAAFQRYYAAWEASDYDGAYALFSSRIRSSVTQDEYRSQALMYGRYDEGSRRVVLLASHGTDPTRVLDLRIDHWSPGGGLSGGATWSSTMSVTMLREGGQWRLDDYLAGLDPLGYMP